MTLNNSNLFDLEFFSLGKWRFWTGWLLKIFSNSNFIWFDISMQTNETIRQATYIPFGLCECFDIYLCICLFVCLFKRIMEGKEREHNENGLRTQDMFYFWSTFHFFFPFFLFSSLRVNTSVPQFLFPLRKKTLKKVALVFHVFELTNSCIQQTLLQTGARL